MHDCVLVISLPKMPYIHRVYIYIYIYMVLANPIYDLNILRPCVNRHSAKHIVCECF